MKKNNASGHPSRLSRISSVVAVGVTALISLSFANGAQLKEARVSQVINDVKLLPSQAAPRPAAVRDQVREGTAVRTGLESRAELTFTDQTLARLGANTVFSFNQGTRNLDLGGGAMLLRVPKDAGGAQINTSAVTAAITGTTVMLEYHPNAFIKFIILEGTGRIFRKGHLGESVLLHAGQMLIVNPNGKGLPDPVDVDLDRLMKTSLLINGFAPLPSGELIARAISAQDSQKNEGGLIETHLVIFGSGTTVALLDPTQTGIADQANSNEVRQSEQTPSPTETPSPTISPTITPTPSPTGTPTPTVSPTPDKFGTPSVIASSTPYEITNDTVISTDPTITTNGITDFGKIYRGPDLDGPASLWFFGSTSAFDDMISFDQNIFVGDRLPLAAFKFSALSLNGNPTITLGAGGPNNLALISVGDLISGPSGGILDFSNLSALLLATQDGSITLSSDLTFANVPTLGVYARGEGSTLTFDSAVSGTAIVGLFSEGDIASTNSLTIAETSGPSAPNGFIISMIAGQSINIGQDLNLSITNTDVMSNALITLNSLGDIIVNGAGGISLTIDNTGAEIQDTASLGIFAGGNLTTSTINLLLENHDGGLIDNVASVTLDVTGTLTTTGDLNLTLDNAETGGTIGSSASLVLSAATISIGGSLAVSIANNAGGSIAGDAILSVNSIGSITTGTDSGFSIDNSIFSNEGTSVGGEITGNATISLLAATVNAGGGLFTFLYNDGGGHIGGDALITAGLAGNLSTQGALFFDVQNSADTDGGTQTFPGGTIDGNAAVTIAVSGPVTSTGLGEFAVLNNDFRFLDVGGTISGSATVVLSATGLSTGTFFQPLVNNTNGSIGGDATVSVAVSGDVSVGAETFFNILNSGGAIGGQAFSTLSANNFTGGTVFNFQILNDGGSIGTNAALSAGLSGGLTIGGDATIKISNIGGSIGGNATISLTAASLQANSLTTLIDSSSAGAIGGAAAITLNITGTVTTTTDATVDIALTPPIDQLPTVASIDLNGGTYEVGGTFHSTITGGDGGITIGTTSLHADILKIGAFGDNGSLTVGGGLLSGDTELKLYAPGSNGQINFISNVTLNSNSSVIIAANAVTISNGVVVTITGDDGVNASVFTNVPNYSGSGGNGNTTGTFAGNGAQTSPLIDAPPFDDGAKGQAKAPTTSGGGTATVLPRNRRPVARVADSNQLLALADQAVGSAATSLNRSSTVAGRNARAASGKGILLAPQKAIPVNLTISRQESRTPLALP